MRLRAACLECSVVKATAEAHVTSQSPALRTRGLQRFVLSARVPTCPVTQVASRFETYWIDLPASQNTTISSQLDAVPIQPRSSVPPLAQPKPLATPMLSYLPTIKAPIRAGPAIHNGFKSPITPRLLGQEVRRGLPADRFRSLS